MLIVPLGHTISVPAARGKTVHVGSKSILQVTDAGNRVLLVGKKKGETHLSVGANTYVVEVVSPATEAFRKKLVSILKDMKGLTSEIEGGKLRVQGTTFSFR